MRERELKMMVPTSFELPDLSDAVPDAVLSGVDERRIDDVYFDTSDLRLARWGCTLRHRADEGWTVKIPKPSKGVVLDREEVVIGGEAGVPPARAVNLVSSLTRGAALDEVARVHTRRHVRRWLTDDGAVIAELADDHVFGVRADGEEVRFREIEVELATGAAAGVLAEITDRLTAAQRRAERPVPKVVRVLGSAATQPPDVDVAPLPTDPTAREVIEAAFSASVARLLLQLPSARLGVDEEGVHQSRVAARRMRSDLQTFEPLLDSTWSSELAAELKWLIDELGAVRDRDVLGARLRELAQRHPEIDADAASRVLHELHDERRRARRRLLRHLNDQRAARLLDHLVDASSDPVTEPRAQRPARDVMPKLVRKRWRRLDRAIAALGRHPAPSELHAVRILAKRVRYAAEAVAPAVGKRARKFAADAAEIQDALGELNDAAVAAVWLAACSERLDGLAAFAAGRMSQQLLVEAGQEHRTWRAAHRSMTKRTAWFS